MVTPWERSGATAAERTVMPAMRLTVGVPTPCATSIRSRLIAKRTRPVSLPSAFCPWSDSRVPVAAATPRRRPCSSSASTTMAPSVWRKRPA
jgi:hypothetical protein